MIVAIDPGPTVSGVVFYDHDKQRVVTARSDLENVIVLTMLTTPYPFASTSELVIEQVVSYGKPVGVEVFETVFWTGRFAQAWDTLRPRPCVRIPRRDVCRHLCNSSRGVGDPEVRQALIDRFGPGRDVAIGRKAAPGPLYEVRKHAWAALAVAVTHADTRVDAGRAAREEPRSLAGLPPTAL